MSVVITGLGCITSLGDSAPAVFEALCAGESGIGGAGHFPGKGPVAAIPNGPHLSSELALHAVREALSGTSGAIGVVGATTSGDMVKGEVAYRSTLEGADPTDDFIWPQLADRPTEIVARELGLTGPRLTLSTACSSGAAAVGIAAEWVEKGRIPRAIAFGADALCGMTIHGFGSLGAMSSERARPFDRNRTGLSLGEGAGALLLEREEDALARGATIYGRIGGYGSATDAHHMTAPEPGGRGARAAMKMAGLDGVDWVCAHGTATPLNDAMEAGVMGSLLPGVPVSSIKGAIGHTLGAAGAVEMVITALAVHLGRLPPNTGCEEPEFDIELVRETRIQAIRAALSVNFAFGGHNAAVRIDRC